MLQVQQSRSHLGRAFDKQSVYFASIEGDRGQVVQFLQTPTLCRIIPHLIVRQSQERVRQQVHAPVYAFMHASTSASGAGLSSPCCMQADCDNHWQSS